MRHSVCTQGDELLYTRDVLCIAALIWLVSLFGDSFWAMLRITRKWLNKKWRMRGEDFRSFLWTYMPCWFMSFNGIVLIQIEVRWWRWRRLCCCHVCWRWRLLRRIGLRSTRTLSKCTWPWEVSQWFGEMILISIDVFLYCDFCMCRKNENVILKLVFKVLSDKMSRLCFHIPSTSPFRNMFNSGVWCCLRVKSERSNLLLTKTVMLTIRVYEP